jgi:predicted N-acetyltransferase YhbS
MFRDAVISILAVIVKQERIGIGERVRAGLYRARAQGTEAAGQLGDPGLMSGAISSPSCAGKASRGVKSRRELA